MLLKLSLDGSAPRLYLTVAVGADLCRRVRGGYLREAGGLCWSLLSHHSVQVMPTHPATRACRCHCAVIVDACATGRRHHVVVMAMWAVVIISMAVVVRLVVRSMAVLLVMLVCVVVLQWSCLLLLEEYLGWHVLNLNESCDSVIRIALSSLLMLHLSKGEDVRLGQLLGLAVLEVLRHEVRACRHTARVRQLRVHLLGALLAHGARLSIRQ